jgi:hypothetical protein
MLRVAVGFVGLAERDQRQDAAGRVALPLPRIHEGTRRVGLHELHHLREVARVRCGHGGLAGGGGGHRSGHGPMYGRVERLRRRRGAPVRLEHERVGHGDHTPGGMREAQGLETARNASLECGVGERG